IQDNPELIMKSVQSFQMKKQAEAASQAAKNIVAMQGDLQNNPNSPVVGNPNGDVTVVEFFDYHCGYCKRLLPAVTQLLNEDKNLRFVFKELPILGEDSITATKVSLAVNLVDKSKYFAFHNAVMKMTGNFTMDSLIAKAKEVGVDEVALKAAINSPEVEKEISHNKELAASLNITGTPAMVIGNDLTPGAVPIDTIKAKIAAARAGKK
ncbi:MAG: DsbA family protein, partial [Pseudomonadota bacterium]